MTNTVIYDAKEVKLQLLQKQDLRLQHIIQLGELTHKKLLENELVNSELMLISAETLQNDKEIYRLAKILMEMTMNQHKCAKCQSAIQADTKFCGKCGQLNAHYTDKTVATKACSTCEEIIYEQMTFCPCCGIQQGGV